MIRRLLSIFRKEKEDELVLASGELADYVKKEFGSFIAKIILPSFNHAREDVESVKQDVENKCSTLERAELRNSKIPQKEKQFMTGNRESYLKQARYLLRCKSPESYLDIEAAYSEFISALEQYGRQTERPRQILAHFFEHEVAAVHSAIYNLKLKYDALLGIIKGSEYLAFLKLMQDTETLLSMENKKRVLAESIESEKSALRDSKKMLASLDRQRSVLAASGEFAEITMMSEEKKSIEANLTVLKSELGDKLAVIGRLLKKYEHVTIDNPKIVKGLLKDPITALQESQMSDINDMLGRMNQSLEQLGFREEKERIKLSSALSGLAEGRYLSEIKKAASDYQSRLEKLTQKLSGATAQKIIDEISEKIRIEKERTEAHKKLLQNNQNELSSINDEIFLAEIQNKIRGLLHKRIIFSDKIG